MVAAFHHLPPSVLPAIQQVEGGKPNFVSVNRNGTQDLGIMQINTRWIVPLMLTTHEKGEVIYQRLKEDSCYNIAVAGAIIKLYLAETNGNLMQAIGNYHSHTPYLNNQYKLKVIQAAYFKNSYISKKKVFTKHFSPYQRYLLKLKIEKKRFARKNKNRNN